MGRIFDRNVDIRVEFADVRFDPVNPREITVIVIAQICLFNFIVPARILLSDLSQQVNIPRELLAEINELDLDSTLEEGDRLLIPDN